MKCMVVVLAVASLCLAEPEADPLHYYAPYGYAGYAPYYYRPYYASGYAGPLPGASYQSVHRLHKREAEADPQLVAGPLTPAFGNLVQTPRGLRPANLEGFSEDVNQDGFVDPVVPAVPAPLFAAPAPVVRTVVSAPAPLVHTVAAPSPIFRALAPTVVAAPAAAGVALTSTDCVTPQGCALKAALVAGTPTGAFGHVTSTIVKREAEAEPEAEADAEADADAYYYAHYGYAGYSPYAYNGFYNYYGAYAGFYNPYAYAASPYFAPAVAAPAVAAPAPVAAPLVKSVTRPVTYTHIGAHPVAPTTVLETETFV